MGGATAGLPPRWKPASIRSRDPASIWFKWRGRGSDASSFAELRASAYLRWRSRGETDRPDPLPAPSLACSLAQRPGTLDAGAARRPGRGAWHRRARQRQHNRSDAKKNIVKPHLNQQFVIPPEANASFVANMEDVLEVYHRPHDPDCPVVCLDETSKQLIAETRTPIEAKPGRPARYDYEYRRNGTANLFMLFAPLEGWRHVEVTDQRTAADFARILKQLSETHFPKAPKIVLGQDNLNTHKPASLYEAFPAPEARRLVERFEWHYTPKHGSWLNMAESELSVLSTQCLDQRIPDKQTLTAEAGAWEAERNKKQTKADWQFTRGGPKALLAKSRSAWSKAADRALVKPIMTDSLPDPADTAERILILDFGSQVTQLIARRLREAGVYC